MSASRQRLPRFALTALLAAIGNVAYAQATPSFFEPSLPPNGFVAGCPRLTTAPSSDIPLHWFRQAPPPLTGSTCLNYANGPVTDASENNVNVFTRPNNAGGSWPRVWANRGPRPAGYPTLPPNNITPAILDTQSPAKPISLEFSSITIANAVTKAEVLQILGAQASVWEAPLVAVGLKVSADGKPNWPAGDLIGYTDLSTNTPNYFRGINVPNSYNGMQYALYDKMIVHDELDFGNPWVFSTSTPPFPTGIQIDYEPHDLRSVKVSTVFLTNLAAAIKRWRFTTGGVTYNPLVYLYTNPFSTWQNANGGSVASNGFSFDTIDQIKDAYDFISLFLTDESAACTGQGANGSIRKAFNESVSFLRGVSGVIKYSKVAATIDEALCGPTQALDVFALNSQYKFGAYMLAPGTPDEEGGQAYDRNQPNSPLSNDNQIIWNLLYGGIINPPAPPY